MRTSPSNVVDPPPGADFDPARLEIGAVVADRYEILGLLGKGGFGWVYRALDREVGEAVALKFLRIASGKRTGGVDRARHEIRAARRISHPNVIRLHDLSECEGYRFLSMEYVAGESLQRWLASRGAIPPGEAIRIVREIAAGVGAAHDGGVVHRDLKPGNILIDAQGRAKVLDFGISALANASGGTEKGASYGTPEYMAPEQTEGRSLTPSADIYSVGVILFEMLTGALPFASGGSPQTVRARHLVPLPDPCGTNPSIPLWLGHVVTRCLATDPAERFATIGELLEAIDHGVLGEDDRPTTPVASRRVGRGAADSALRAAPRFAPAALVLLGLALTIPAIRDAQRGVSPTGPPLFADGVVRLEILDLDPITDDATTRMVSAGLSEALRARLARRSDLRIVGVPTTRTRSAGDDRSGLGVEQILSGRVGRLGQEVRVQIAVTSGAGSERWMSFESSLRWEESWEKIDTLAASIAAFYEERLDEEKAREGKGR